VGKSGGRFLRRDHRRAGKEENNDMTLDFTTWVLRYLDTGFVTTLCHWASVIEIVAGSG